MAPSRPSAALGILATAVAGLYADRYLGLSYDLRQLANERDGGQRLQKSIDALGDRTNIYHVLELADPDATALWFEKRTWTYALLRLDADRLATLLAARGVGQGSCVAVMMSNSPEFLIAICALSRLAAIPSMINTSLRKDTLRHCLDVCHPIATLVTPDLAFHLLEAQPSLDIVSVNLGSYGPLTATVSENHHISRQIRLEDLVVADTSSLPPPARQSVSDTAMYMYTSGTSGRPKAICIKNFLLIVVTIPQAVDIRNPRKYFPLRNYCCLPLFHGTGFFCGFMYCLGCSGTLCLSRKFSASRVAQELYESSATRMVYVGELCRYMLKAKPSPYDRSHACRVAWGNGLRPEVWTAFKRKFNIPEIREVYRATEGIAKYDNYQFGSQGSGMVGRSGLLRQYMESVTFLVRHDGESQAPYRDPKTGYCILAKVDEPGEAIGRVQSMAVYNKYLDNKDANEEKLIRDVFQKGDVFQRSGDLLVRQADGWIRFYDRSGDTFRWKGENVSAGEVREHIGRLPEVQDVRVFTTKLANYDGSAGAAEIVLESADVASECTFMAQLFERLCQRGLTSYQLPRLVRVLPEINTTATFKHVVAQQSRSGWDPALPSGKGRMYWLNGANYATLDGDSWAMIASGRAKI